MAEQSGNYAAFRVVWIARTALNVNLYVFKSRFGDRTCQSRSAVNVLISVYGQVFDVRAFTDYPENTVTVNNSRNAVIVTVESTAEAV